MKVAQDLTELVGNTPLLKPNRFLKENETDAEVYFKVEYFNPAGSVKDRIALGMIEDAEEKGILKPGSTIIEPTSGNTGVGLSFVGAIKGYNVILTMPDTMSVERRTLVTALGAQVVLTPGAQGMKGAIRQAEALNAQIENSVILQQFENGANARTHENTTAQEIWNDTDGKVDIFVAGVGTGGTVTGVGRGLKKLNPDVKIVAVEPFESPVLSGGNPGPHKIQGIGAGFVPKVFGEDVIDEILQIRGDEAIDTSRLLGRKEGLLVGISSGAAAAGALMLAKRPENKGKTIVALLPDTGERYLSTVLYQYPTDTH
ncbi:MAG: cysteine synthase A [Lachnospiraceae bacterium]|nr:cysteine synthase A [Lachnospiraceae bacterium]